MVADGSGSGSDGLGFPSGIVGLLWGKVRGWYSTVSATH